MFSNKTYLEITEAIENLSHSEIDRLIAVFKFSKIPPAQNATKVAKTTEIYHDIKLRDREGPFSDSMRRDLVEYLIERYFKTHPGWERGDTAYNPNGENQSFKNAFSQDHKNLSNSLKRDGFTVEGKTLKKMLPSEIEEYKTESELETLLNRFNFSTSLGHLKQAIENHSGGNWAGANSQFRTFIEALLIEICNSLLPNNNPNSANAAIKLLTDTVNPPFLSTSLNEVGADKKPTFVNGLWARLNPEGSHPGLSDENDSTFRYHICIVFAHYILKRYETMPNNT